MEWFLRMIYQEYSYGKPIWFPIAKRTLYSHSSSIFDCNSSGVICNFSVICHFQFKQCKFLIWKRYKKKRGEVIIEDVKDSAWDE